MNLTEGLKVIDITSNYAGPGAAALLAVYGAEVIHIERPVLGDDSRHFPPKLDGESLNFVKTNHSKKSVVLDMKDPRAIDIILKMAEESDIFIESYRPGVMKGLGLDYETIKRYNDKIIYCSVSGFGQTGPYAQRPGYDVIAQAYSGLMYKTGEPDGHPTKSGTVIGDSVGTLNAFAAIMSALYHRERTGEGQYIDISLARGLVYMSVNLNFTSTGEVGQRTGNHDRGLCPYGIFEGNDGEAIVIGAVNSATWVNLCKAMGKNDLAFHPDFVSNDVRVANKSRVNEIVTEWVKSMSSVADVEKRLLECGVPCSMIYDDKMVFEDVHARECGWITAVPVSEGITSVDTFYAVSGPMELEKCKPEFRQAPVMGQHNVEVLSRFGLTKSEIEQMQAEWKAKALSKRK